jgi:superfamily II DNA or RNA helicase
MADAVRFTFHRGTIVVDAPWAPEARGVLWDARTGIYRAAAYRLCGLLDDATARGSSVATSPHHAWHSSPRPSTALELRDYQRDALRAWSTFGGRGLVVLPTGAGKTRLAIAAILEKGLPAAVLCPTRALAAAWVVELGRWLKEPIGLVSDGARRFERTTVLTFESAYRHMDTLGDRFGLLVVDEVHHFGSGARVEALESSAALARLGLTATAPPIESEEMARIDDLVGPVVYELGFEDLLGTHLARLERVRIPVRLTPEERAAYTRGVWPFRELRRAYLRGAPGADYIELVRALGKTPAGRRALRMHAAAQELAAFPREKRSRVRELLAQHRGDKTIVFTGYVENAYEVGVDNLVPVIAGETTTREREEILTRFGDGRLRAIAAARVLNEGIDVPDASVAIIVAGALGAREHVQRIGRVLRPSPGKNARAYELVTLDTGDERKSLAREPRAS